MREGARAGPRPVSEARRDPPDLPGEPLAAFAYRQLAAQAAELAYHAEAARTGGGAEAVHGMRVATRRARSALRSFRAVLPGTLHSAFYGELRWLAGVLGEARDLDVYRERFRECRRLLSAPDAAALEPHEHYLELERQRVSAGLSAALASPRCMRLLAGFRTAVERGPSSAAPCRPTVRDAAADYIACAAARVLKRGRKIGKRSAPRRLHALRIRDKRFRYLLEFFAPLYGEGLKPAIRAAVRLQDILGLHQDAFTAAARLREYAAGVRPDGDFRGELLALGELVACELGVAKTARRRFLKEWRSFEAALADLVSESR